MTSLEDLDFADDLVLLSHKIKNTRDKTRALEEEGVKSGLEDQCRKNKADAYR